MQKIFSETEKNPAAEIEVNIEKQTITLLSTGEHENFEINEYKKTCLINGFDDIDDADAAVNGKAKPRPNSDENNMFCWYFTFQRNASSKRL